MKIDVLFFSVLQDIVGSESLVVPLTDLERATLDGLLIYLCANYPDLSAWEGRLLFAVNQEFAGHETVIPAGAEVAIMPPVQGG